MEQTQGPPGRVQPATPGPDSSGFLTAGRIPVVYAGYAPALFSLASAGAYP